MEDDDLDVRVEIKVAMFWRGLIGDGEYGKFNPKDMFRWYQALELLGPEDVRDLYRRRQSNRPMPIVQGLDRAPHPPAWLVETWLDKHETKIRTGSLWLGMGAFTSIWFLFGTYMNGCQNMHQSTTDPLLTNPPNNGPVVMLNAQPMAPPADIPVAKNPPPPLAELTTFPTPGSPNIISAIPVQPSLPGSTIRTSPLQEAAQPTPSSQPPH
jgi:hypothetical protein